MDKDDKIIESLKEIAKQSYSSEFNKYISNIVEQSPEADENEMKRYASEQLKINDVIALKDRDYKNSQLFQSYIDYYNKKSKTNLFLKKAFFWFFMIFMSVIIVAIPVGIIVLASIGKLNNSTIITAFTSSVISMVTAIIVIPKIIAQYLFSLKEDEVISSLVLKIQENDEATRHLHNNSVNK